MIKKSFAPLLPDRPAILILGSLPGDRSLLEQQYYAHPQNRFWKVIAALANVVVPVHYSARITLLSSLNIAVWDVCAQALRQGSMDTNIRTEIPNDIPALLLENPSIRIVAFNGQAAQKLYDRYFDRISPIRYCTLPSTSPANAQFTLVRLVEEWKKCME